jgi:hypothetical protein
MAESGRIPTWDNLACPHCSAETFIPVMHLKAKYGAGTTTEQAGWQCSGCGTKADVLEMQNAAYLRQRKADLAALEAEVAQHQPAARPATSGSPNSPRS